MEITKEQVEHVARLARLEVSEDEKAMFARQLSGILTYMDQLKELDTKGVEPTATVLPTDNVFRDDNVRPSLTQERALANAPDQADGFFRVPKILEDR
ncbi:MAG TPA: Asp-tRNA(Asn)/Glu-tRNA(Gln) amidotransferase subunit GatC [Nitrospirales bacterium]|jgi:aspartyl-tRNA(Asn)/glutamyl-tRNA(Gln) amidotransferase subunit C|nr:Asp-tRNA(Asn)/Glu-tRNA(Gln) amidotransferase subunit GatC [Nitrospirales bacterium]